jgi:hypothetical protein
MFVKIILTLPQKEKCLLIYDNVTTLYSRFLKTSSRLRFFGAFFILLFFFILIWKKNIGGTIVLKPLKTERIYAG